MNAIRRRGFTLIELLIAVAIVALLASVAYPQYADSVLRNRRAEGKAALLKTAQLMERYYTEKNTYTTDVGLLYGGSGAPVGSGEDALKRGYYAIVAAGNGPNGIAQGYLLTASPGNAASTEKQEQVFTDAKCGSLTLTSEGVKGRTGTLETLDRCWNR